jgi:hypothetical protein
MAARILVVFGACLLLIAAFFFADAILPNGTWGPSGAGFGLLVASFPGVPGACAFLLGVHLMRRAHRLRERNDAREWNCHSLRGVVSNQSGSPVPHALVDVFPAGMQAGAAALTLRTDAGGRFSADLPEGKYVLEVQAPEIGESSLQVDVSNSAGPALEIKLVENSVPGSAN